MERGIRVVHGRHLNQVTLKPINSSGGCLTGCAWRGCNSEGTKGCFWHSDGKALQSPGPTTEPRNPGTPKVHFKVRNMPFWTPRKKGPKSQLKCPKRTTFGQLTCPKMVILGHLNWLFGPFSGGGGAKWHFQTLKCTFGVSGFRGSGAL